MEASLLLTTLVIVVVSTALIWAVAACVLAGAVAFTGLDKLVKSRFGSDSGGGLLAVGLDRWAEAERARLRQGMTWISKGSDSIP